MNKKRKATITSVVSLIALLAFVVAIIIPLGGFVIDICVTLSLALAIVIYMRAGTITDWKDLKTFPTIILLTCIFRIALNIATTKQILLTGDAGNVIESAGHFIVGGSVWVGFVVFIILIVVQFIIANGASRTSEVSARFTLDKIPGKQMSIDADLQSGLIDDKEAKRRREELDLEIEFYGNMDGSGKFIKGDVIAGIVLIIVNIVFGFIMGVLVQGMEMSEAILHYTILTIGDGLVNQLASLLITIATGVVLTRVYDGDENVSQIIFKELTANPMVLYITGSIFVAMAIFTEMPFIPFTLIGGLFIYIAYRNQQKQVLVKEEQEAMQRMKIEEEEKIHKESIEVITELEPITLEVGIRLIPLVDLKQKGETLADKITLMRERIGTKLGVRIPKVHIVDNPSLMSNEYQINIKGVSIAKSSLRPEKLLAVRTGSVTRDLDAGIPTKDPIFGTDAYWIDEMDVNSAKSYGYVVNDALAILSLHLTEIIYQNIHELITRQEVQNLLDNLATRDKVLIDEIKKYDISLSLIQKVVANLLKERISIRDLTTIIEAIIDGVNVSQNVDDITTIVRERISRQICENNVHKDGKIYAIFLSKEVEELDKVEKHTGYHFDIPMREEQALMLGLQQQIDKAQMAGVEPTIIATGGKARACLAKLMFQYSFPYAVMLSDELVANTKIKKIGIAELVYQK